MVAPRGLFGSQQCQDDNVGASDNDAGNTPSKDTEFRQPTNQFHPPPPPPPGCSYPPLQPPFPGAPQFYHQAPFNMTPSSQLSSGVTNGYHSYGPSWQAYGFPQRGYGGPQMIPSQNFTGHGPSSEGALRVSPESPGNNPVIRPTSCTSTAAGQRPGAPGTPPFIVTIERFMPAAELHRTDVAGIADVPPLPDISYDQYDVDYESDNLSDLEGAEGNASISFTQTEFSLKQFAKGMGQPNISMLNKWMKVWVAAFLGKKYQSIIRGQNHLKQLHDGPLHWETAVAAILNNFETLLAVENFDNTQWIRRQWVEMFLTRCAIEVLDGRKKGSGGNKRLATDLGPPAGNQGRGNLPDLLNATFIVVIRQVPNGNNDQTSSMHLQGSYTDVRHWEELIDFIEQNCSPKQPYSMTEIYIISLTQKEMDEEYRGLYPPGPMMNDCLSGQISYNSFLSYTFKLKLGHDLKPFLVEMKAAVGKDIVEHVIGPVKVIPASSHPVSHDPLLIRIRRHRREPIKMN